MSLADTQDFGPSTVQNHSNFKSIIIYCIRIGHGT